MTRAYSIHKTIIQSAAVHFCLAILLCNFVHAQTLPFHHYTTKEDLPSNRITALFQDSRGFLWIGSDEGLTIYDGGTFKTLTVVDGLPNPFVTSIIESRISPAVLWIATIATGIAKYEHGQLTSFRFGKEFAENVVGTIVEDDSGIIWCETSKGIFRTAGDSLRYVPITPREYLGGGDIARAADGSIWVGFNRKIYVQSPPEHTVRIIDLDFRPTEHINHMIVDRDGDLWVCGSDGSLRRFVAGNLVSIWYGDTYGVVNGVVTDRDGDLWLTTGNGLLRAVKREFPKGVSFVFGGFPNAYESYLEPILEDREGDIWFGGAVTGVHKLARKNTVMFSLLNNVNGLSDNYGHFWLMHGNEMSEIWKDKANTWKTFSHHVDHSSEKSHFAFLDRDVRGRLWLRFTDATFTCDSIISQGDNPSILREVLEIKSGRDFPFTYFEVTYIDGKDLLWMSIGPGIGVMDLNFPRPKYLGQLKYPEEIQGASIRSIFRDSKSNVWFGSFSGGLDELVGGDLGQREIRHFSTDQGLPDNGIRSMAEDARGRLWIGTRFGGAAIYDGNKFQTLSVKEGLLSNAVWSLASDNKHRMWLGTGAGAMAVDVDSLPKLRWSESLSKDPSAVYFSPLTRNVMVLNYHDAIIEEADPPPATQPPVCITNVTVNDRPREFLAPLELSYLENNCMIDFVGLRFRNEQPLRYQYRLRGIDDDWNAPTRTRSVSYATLSPGSYTFEVRAVTGEGWVSPAPAVLTFTIVPPVWQRWWFSAFAGLLFVGVGPIVYYRRVSRLQKEKSIQQEFAKRLIESQEHERKRIAAELHDSLGQNLLVIQNNALLALDSDPGNAEIKDRLNDISAVTTQTIGDVREIALNLRPYHLDKLGLTTSITAVIRRISESSKIIFSSEIDSIDDVFSKEEQSHLYRIVQEGLNNIVKHSQATEAAVIIKNQQGAVWVTIKDNGKGFGEQRSALPGPDDTPIGFGLIGIGERVRILNGHLSFSSTPGQGTLLVIDIPHRGSDHA